MSPQATTATSSHIAVIQREQGVQADALPLWTDDGAAIDFEPDAPAILRRDVVEVPGCFILENVLSPRECDQFIRVTETMGYHEDSPVMLPRRVRHNDNVNWIVSEAIDRTIWRRSAPLVRESVGSAVARGINARFRFYRYGVGDYFEFHKDGSWPGSRVRGGDVIDDAYAPWHSAYTCLILLSDDFDGGRTLFKVPGDGGATNLSAEGSPLGVRTPKGGALCFPHGTHPLHCLHAGEEVSRGRKYVIRTDILFG